jgi:hypothetical protein
MAVSPLACAAFWIARTPAAVVRDSAVIRTLRRPRTSTFSDISASRPDVIQQSVSDASCPAGRA